MKSVAVAAGIIENERGEILIAERPPGRTLAGSWEFPGGKLEADESAEQALHRELKEELNLDIRIVQNLGTYPYRYDWGAVVLHVFRVSALNTPRPTEDIQNFRWVRPSDLDVTSMAAADVEPFYSYLKALPST